jgi:cytochrome c oxidase subunit III
MADLVQQQNSKWWWNGGRSPFNINYGKVMMWYFLMSDAFTFGAFLISYATLRFSMNAWVDANQVFNSFPFLHGFDLPLAFVSLMTFILIFSSVTMVLAVHEGHRMNKKGVEKYMLWTIIGGAAFLGCQAWEWTHLLTAEHLVLKAGVLDTLNTTVSHNPWGLTQATNAEVLKSLATAKPEVLTSIIHEYNHSFNTANATQSSLLQEATSLVNAGKVHVGTYGPPAFGSYFFGITGFHGFHVLSGVVINIIMYIKTKLGHFEQRGHYEMIEKTGLYWHFVDLVWVFVFLCFYLI